MDRRIIALLLVGLVMFVSGCVADNTTGVSGENSPLGEAFQGAGSNPDASSPPAMPAVPGGG